MKKIKHLVVILVLLIVIAAVLSLTIVRRDTYEVGKGFYYGAPQSQNTTTIGGTYTVNRYGFPSTYREQQTFTPDGDIFNESTYENHGFDGLYVLTNILFWMGLFVALLSPLTIFYRPKKHIDNEPEHQSHDDFTEIETPSQVKSNENFPPQ